MPSNDEVVLGIPQIFCPSCNQLFDINKGRVDKLSKAQRKRMTQSTNTYGEQPSRNYQPDPFPNGEDSPSEMPEKNFIVVSCNNFHCEQYNKFKVLRLPRLHTPSVKVDLSD